MEKNSRTSAWFLRPNLGLVGICCSILLLCLSCKTAFFGSAPSFKSGGAVPGKRSPGDPTNSNNPNNVTNIDNGGMNNPNGPGGDPKTPPEKIDLPGFPKDPGAVDGDARLTPRFAMLARDLECAACHLKVKGDVVTVGNVGNWSAGHIPADDKKPDRELVLGRWLVSGTFSKIAYDGVTSYPITVRDGVSEHYTGPEMPKSFPEFTTAAVRANATGSVHAPNLPAPVKAYSATPIVLIGTQVNPIILAGDVVVEGDVVIKGWYRGVGTIYAGGNIYIPADLRAVSSVFPFPDDPKEARVKARQLLHSSEINGLGLAANGSVFLGDLDTPLYPTPDQKQIKDDPNSPFAKSLAGKFRGDIGIDHIYTWFPGGKPGYDALYESGKDCHDPNKVQTRAFSLIEAFIYSRHTLGGIARMNSYAINGGIIADVLHIIGRSSWRDNPCPEAISPVHGLTLTRNHINYDYRMQVGLPIMTAFSRYFKPILGNNVP